jgi:polysaccharide export outer membrane protein
LSRLPAVDFLCGGTDRGAGHPYKKSKGSEAKSSNLVTRRSHPSQGRRPKDGDVRSADLRFFSKLLESYAGMQRISNSLPWLLSLMVLLGILGLLQTASAQNSSPQSTTHEADTAKQPSEIVPQPLPVPAEQKTTSQAVSSGLVIGPGDDLEITVYGAPDLSGHARVSGDGNISMPLIGYVRIAGLSSSEAEAAIEAQLRQNSIVNNPQVAVYVKEYASSGISVAGEVAKPGFYSVLGPHRLFDVLQAAGGTTDKAADKVLISHRGQNDATTVYISKDPAKMAASNVELEPGDTVVVPRAGIVYVLGEVTKPGGYVLNSTGGITALQVVAVAGGPTHVASAGKTRLLRRSENGFQEQRIDLKKLLRGKTQDVAVRDQDILFIPSSAIKTALSASALVAVAASTAIYRVPF